MDKQLLTLQHNLEAAAQRADAEGIEFCFARDLQAPLGYARWENFQTAINRAIESCQAIGHAASDHFRGVTKLIAIQKIRWIRPIPLLWRGGRRSLTGWCNA